MYWLKKSFVPYCKTQGYDIMQDDLKFIEKSLKTFREPERRPILYKYAETWRQAMSAEQNELKKQSAGRRAANLFMLKTIGKL